MARRRTNKRTSARGRKLLLNPSPAGKERGVTIGQFLNYLSPELTKERFVPIWPPDIFAVAASILEKCGGYIQLVRHWPPGKRSRKNTRKRWVKKIYKIAKRWREAAIRSRRPPGNVMT